MVTESDLEHDKSIEWSKFLQAKFPPYPHPPSPLFPPFNAISETLLQLLLSFLFTPSLFHFKLYKFLLTPLQCCDYIAYKLIKYNQFQISENKPDETPYVML